MVLSVMAASNLLIEQQHLKKKQFEMQETKFKQEIVLRNVVIRFDYFVRNHEGPGSIKK